MLQYNLLGITQTILLLSMISMLCVDGYTTKNLSVIYILIAVNVICHYIHHSCDGIAIGTNLLVIVYSKLPY